MRGVLRAGAVLALWVFAATGCIYMNVVQPLDTDLEETRLGSKVGKAEAQAILGLFAWGDAGTQAAAKAALAILSQSR